MKLYGISFLMDILNIKTKELANFTNVDRTLISKWRTGARKIDGNTNYFSKIIELLILKNRESGVNILEEVLGLEKVCDDKKLYNRLSQFIINNEAPNTYYKYINNDHSYSYITHVPIYEGDAAKGAAILNLLNIAENESPCKLTFVYDCTLEFIVDDSEFLEKYTNKLLKLLDSGFTLDFLYSAYSAPIIFLNFYKVLIHERSTFYEFSVLFNFNKFSIHMIEDKLVLVGMREKEKSHPFESTYMKNDYYYNCASTFSDPISLHSYKSIANNVKERAEKLIKPLNEDIVRAYEIYNEDSYDKNIDSYNKSFVCFSNKSPSWVLMNEKLFIEVLDQSYTDSKDKKEMLKLYRFRRKNLFNQLENLHVTHLYPLMCFSKMLENDEITLGVKDCIIYPQLTIKKEQVKRFFIDIIELLEEQENFHICLTNELGTQYTEYKFGWYVLKNILFLFNNSSNPSYSYITNNSFIHSVLNFYSEKLIHANKRENNNEYIIQILRELL